MNELITERTVITIILVVLILAACLALGYLGGRADAYLDLMTDETQEAKSVARVVRWPAWFLVVDVETTCLDEKRGSMVSIGAVHPLTGDTFYCACRVREGAYVESDAMAVNMADWIENPILPTEGEAVAKLAKWAAKRGGRLIGGKNPTFDVRWLEAAWKRAEFPAKFPFTHRTIDLHALVLAWALVERPHLVMAEKFKTDDLYAALGLPSEPRPRT